MSKSAIWFLPLPGPAKSQMSHECQIFDHWELALYDAAALETLHNKARSVLVVVQNPDNRDNDAIAHRLLSPSSRSNLTAWSLRVSHDLLTRDMPFAALVSLVRWLSQRPREGPSDLEMSIIFYRYIYRSSYIDPSRRCTSETRKASKTAITEKTSRVTRNRS